MTAPSCAAGTMTRRIAVHFCPAFTVISRATSLMKMSNSGVPSHRIRTQRRRVQRIPFGDEADGVARDGRMVAQLFRSFERAGEGQHVLAGQMVEQIAGRAGDELQGALSAGFPIRS